MYEVSIKTRFSAAHHLKGYRGACACVHGHNWETIVYIRGRNLDRIGILVDFKEVKKCVKKAIDELDHADLNKLPVFKKCNPTSENIARHLFGKISGSLNGKRYTVVRVTVGESPDNRVTYWQE
ncbi:MAG: 6-carboxytetrahydropterin synthase QueD [bacterium]